MEESKRENKQESAQELLELGASTTKSSKGNIYTLTIIGQIEGHQTLPETVKTTKYEHVIPLLAAVEESEDIDGLLLLLNTVGGDIEAGLAIAELIAGMKKPTVSLGIGRRALDRDSAGRFCQTRDHCPASQHDRAPCAYDGVSRRRAADVSLF